MKKTVSINISGVIFHIEEDGYDKLKSYLASIQQYFSTYEDSQEIITDIENRIAEKLLAKLKADDQPGGPRQAVSIDDVNQLIRTMGTVADFEAGQEEEVLVSNGHRAEATARPATAGYAGGASAPSGTVPPVGSTTFGAGTPPPYGSATTSVPPHDRRATDRRATDRRLVRDLRRKTLGGVAAGLANYFNVDPVWVRLAFVLLVIGFPVLGDSINGDGDFFGSLAGITVLAYVAMWIAFPGSMTLEDDKSVKKFYRNPDDQVLGGVASGIAAYFGIDPGLVRLLFVIGIVFFGVGFLFYIVLWIISPTANTLTEKMEMQGQPITLSNIEHNIKSSLNVPDNAPENGLTKVLLFPFRLIAMVVNGLGRALGPLLGGLVSVVRVFAGLLLLFIAFCLMVACLGVAGAALGVTAGMPFGEADIPVNLLRNDIGVPMILAGLVAGVLPAIGLGVLGLMLITRRTVINSRTAVTLAGVWLVSLLILSATVPSLVNEFRREGRVEVEQPLNVVGTPTLALNDLDSDWDMRPQLALKGYDGPQFKLVQQFEAQGSSRQQAEANARQVVYRYVQRDSTIRFDNAIELRPNARFRAQRLEMDLYVPYERPFRLTRDFAGFIQNEFGEKEFDRMEQTLWKFTKDQGLVSLNFPRELANDGEDEFDTDDAIGSALRDEFGDDFYEKGEYTRGYDVKDFDRLQVSGAFAVRVQRGDTFRVVADGRERDVEDLRVRVKGRELVVEYDRRNPFSWTDRKRTGLTITVPVLVGVQLAGASQAAVSGFGAQEKLDLDLSGACRVLYNGTVGDLSVDLSGASKAILKGKADRLTADLSGACKLEGQEMAIDRADVDASGASKADLGSVGSLNAETSGASKVTRRSGDIQ